MFRSLFKKSSMRFYAPLTGEIVTLETVPDPVFSEKMMGDGIAIIPSEGEIVSPVAGKVIQIPNSNHAIGLLATNGTEILIHVGLETVALKGQGFIPKVQTGDIVSPGQQLLEFDLNYVAKHAKEIITPVVITNSKESKLTYVFTNETESKAGETVIFTASVK